MEFEEFQTWLSDILQIEHEYQTLNGKSYLYARFDNQNRVINVRLRTGYQGQLRYVQIRRVFERY